jgi:CubicO group peptidase (beta-lactamase class C family)
LRLVGSIIDSAIQARVFPGAVVEAGSREGRWSGAFGTLTYAADSPRVTLSTVYDLASLTKVIATATQAMRAIDAGAVSLERRLTDYLPAWRGDDRAGVRIVDLLEHASGLTAYLPFFRDHRGRADFETAICTLPLEYSPRTQSIYSDLGFILLGFILEDVGFPLSDLPSMSAIAGDADAWLGFTPPRALGPRCAPTELDLWRGRLLQGEVHDENCWTLGGVAGHAGMFGTASAVGAFARAILAGLLDSSTPGDTVEHLGVRRATLARFVRKSSVPGSSRALAWDTMLPTSSCGTRLSARAVGHTGFTGTSLWIDPERDLYVVLLTNRVHPTRDNNRIRSVRRQVHEELAAEVGSRQ